MRTSAHVFQAAALIAVAAAAPAPEAQAIALGEIFGAAPVTQSGPPLAAITETDVISTAALLASISDDVTDVATAVITGAAASNAANINPPSAHKRSAISKRSVEKRDLLANILSLLGARFNNGYGGSGSAQTTSAAAPPLPAAAQTTSSSAQISAPAINNNAVASSTAAPVASSSSSSSSAPAATSGASSTTNGGSGTSTSSSSTSCPTTPEEGTYCGFINPEDPCAPQPNGNGPNVTAPNDTPDAFMAYAPFQAMAAAAITPNGYAKTFGNYNASTSANSYMGLYTINKYDPSICAAKCDSTNGCTSFNLYIERDPSLNPCKNDSTAPTVWGYWCPNPSSITNFKCTLWGSNIDGTTAVNQGGWREDFAVVITGSNGYDKTNNTVPVVVQPVNATSSSSSAAAAQSTSSTTSSSSRYQFSTSSTPTTTSTSFSAVATRGAGVATQSPVASVTPDPAWDTPHNCSGRAINAGNYWLGSKFFNGPFDASLCAAFASATTQTNRQAALDAGRNRYTPCQMFNAYHVYKNSQQPMGTYCALYTAQLSTSWATTSGSYSGRDFYQVRNSWTFNLKQPDDGRC